MVSVYDEYFQVRVESCSTALKSIELQLVRVETCGCAEGYAKDGKWFVSNHRHSIRNSVNFLSDRARTVAILISDVEDSELTCWK